MESTAQYWRPVWEALEQRWRPRRRAREGAPPLSGTLHFAQAQSNRGPGGRKKDFPDAALCSPTRAALLSGRNHYTVGMGAITEFATSAPGQNSMKPNTCAALAETLNPATRLGMKTVEEGRLAHVRFWNGGEHRGILEQDACPDGFAQLLHLAANQGEHLFVEYHRQAQSRLCVGNTSVGHEKHTQVFAVPAVREVAMRLNDFADQLLVERSGARQGQAYAVADDGAISSVPFKLVNRRTGVAEAPAGADAQVVPETIGDNLDEVDSLPYGVEHDRDRRVVEKPNHGR